MTSPSSIPLSRLPSFSSWFNSIPPCSGSTDKLYMTSVLTEQQKTLEVIAKRPMNGNLIVGIADFSLLNAVAIRDYQNTHSSPYLLLIERSLQVESFWKKLPATIKLAKNRHDAISRIDSLLRTNNSFGASPDYSPMQELNEEIKSNISWLSDDARFVKVQTMFAQGRIAFKRLNFYDSNAFAKLARIFEYHHLKVDLLYLSNVHDFFCLEQDEKQYVRSIKAISSPDTMIIRLVTMCCIRCEAIRGQMIYLPGDPNLFNFKIRRKCFWRIHNFDRGMLTERKSIRESSAEKIQRLYRSWTTKHPKPKSTIVPKPGVMTRLVNLFKSMCQQEDSFRRLQ